MCAKAGRAAAADEAGDAGEDDDAAEDEDAGGADAEVNAGDRDAPFGGDPDVTGAAVGPVALQPATSSAASATRSARPRLPVTGRRCPARS